MKYSVWVVYVGCATAIVFGSGWVYGVGHFVLWLTLGAHLAEFLVKRPVMQRAGGSMGGHFLQTLIYGLFHWKPLEEQQQLASAAAEPASSD